MGESHGFRRRHRHLLREQFRYKSVDVRDLVLANSEGGNKVILKVGRGISPSRSEVSKIVDSAQKDE